MPFDDLYDAVLALWPDEVDLTGTILHANGGATIPKLVEVHDRTEAICSSRGPEYEAMDWSLFQAVHEAAQEAARNGDSAVRISNISKESVQARFKSNLQSIRASGDGDST